MFDRCGTVAGWSRWRAACQQRERERERERETLHVSVLPYSCSICPSAVSVCLSWLLRSRVRKFQRDLWITLYIGLRIHNTSGFFRGVSIVLQVMGKTEDNYLCLFVWASLIASYFLFFERPLSSWAGSGLIYKTVMKAPIYYWHFIV
jgi:hypothetical protein